MPDLKKSLAILNRINGGNYDSMMHELTAAVLPHVVSSPMCMARFVESFVQKASTTPKGMVVYARMCADFMGSKYRPLANAIAGFLRTAVHTHCTIHHTVFFAHMYVVQVIGNTEAGTFVRTLSESSNLFDVERAVAFLQVAGGVMESKTRNKCATALHVFAILRERLQGDFQACPRICILVQGVLDSATVIPASKILSECSTLRERRCAGLLLLNQALQRAGGSSYAACRRAVDIFCVKEKVNPEDQRLMQQYLSEYLLAGNTFTSVDEVDVDPSRHVHLNITDRVRVTRKNGEEHVGTVKYIGLPQFAHKGRAYTGTWIGIALDEAKGTNNGTIDRTEYFHTKPNHGIFVRAKHVTLIADPPSYPVFVYPQDHTGSLIHFDIRLASTKKFEGLVHGDHISTPDGTSAGTIVGTRYGVLYWHMDGATGASPCQDTAAEVHLALKKKDYKVVGRTVLPNYTTDPFESLASSKKKLSSAMFGLLWTRIAESTRDRLQHLVKESDTVEGVLIAPSLAACYMASRHKHQVHDKASYGKTSRSPSTESSVGHPQSEDFQ
jgi:hypothetical protein